MKDILDDVFQMPQIDEYTYGVDRNYSFYLFKNQEREHNNLMRDLINMFAISSPIVDSFMKKLKNGEILEVVFSEEAIRKMKSGEWKIVDAKDKDGFFRALVKDRDGKIVEHGLLKKNEIPKGINIGQLACAMQGMAIQQQLKELSEQLENITCLMKDVVVGQQNDRIALFYSASNKYREALAIGDINLKGQLKIEAISSLNDSIEKIKQDTIYRIGVICNEYDEKRGIYKKLKIVEEHIPTVKKNLQIIHNSMALKTAIYCNEGEYGAAVQSLLAYKNFIISSLSKDKIKILYYADSNDEKLEGFWMDKSSVLPNKIDVICNQIQNMNSYSLEYKKEMVG